MTENDTRGVGLVVLLLLTAIAAHVLGYSQIATIAFWGALAAIALALLLIGVVVLIVVVVILWAVYESSRT